MGPHGRHVHLWIETTAITDLIRSFMCSDCGATYTEPHPSAGEAETPTTRKVNGL